MEINYRDRSITSSTGYIKALNFYMVCKSPIRVPMKHLIKDYVEATEEEYLDYKRFVIEREKARNTGIDIELFASSLH